MPETVLTAMISSTSKDLPAHRQAMMDACLRTGISTKAMEHLTANSTEDPIGVSLRLVEQGDIYILILANRYGYRPKDLVRNPNKLSITELEYHHAVALGKHILIFVMDPTHPTVADNVEKTTTANKLLDHFKKEVTTKHTVAFFTSSEDLKAKALQALQETSQKIPREAPTPDPDKPTLPEPPARYASSDYVGGNRFLGRTREMNRLHAWGAAPDPIMVVEGIGGLGKSALTWTWVTEHAATYIPNLAGVVWWSFYEGGTSLRSMIRYTLAYITRTDPESLRGENPDTLKKALLQHLKQGRYLLVFDGFERALVAYQRWRAEYMTDDEVDEAEAKAAKDVAIRACADPADAEFLSRLVTCTPSKCLFSTRLLPSHFQDRHSEGLLKGVQHIQLNGLDPTDAYAVLLDCGVKRATRAKVDDYLRAFGYHSLLVKVIAGQVKRYRPAPANFDAWLAAKGSTINLTDLNLSQRQSNILQYAFDGLSADEERLLGLIAALSGAAKWETLSAINPLSDLDALDAALATLVDHALLQWDDREEANSYDLHPIVRAYAFERLGSAGKTEAFNRLHAHFNSLPADDTENATELKHIETSIEIYRALVGAGRYDEAAEFYSMRLLAPIKDHVSAYVDGLRLLKPLFRDGDDQPPPLERKSTQSAIMTTYASLLYHTGQSEAALHMEGLVTKLDAEMKNAEYVGIDLLNFAISLQQLNRLAGAIRVLELSRDLATAARDHDGLAWAHLYLLSIYTDTGQWQAAAEHYAAFTADPPRRQRDFWRGNAERYRAMGLVMQGHEARAALDRADELAQQTHNSIDQRVIAQWRGEAALHQRDDATAIEHFRRAVQMATQAGGYEASEYMGRLALAYALQGDAEQATFHLGEALQSRTQGVDDLDISAAEVYWHLGQPDQARAYALKGYKTAWGDGPPYSWWWHLQRATAVLEALGEPLPVLPPHDPARIAPFEFEADVRAMIEAERVQQEEREREAERRRQEREQRMAAGEPDPDEFDFEAFMQRMRAERAAKAAEEPPPPAADDDDTTDAE